MRAPLSGILMVGIGLGLATYAFADPQPSASPGNSSSSSSSSSGNSGGSGSDYYYQPSVEHTGPNDHGESVGTIPTTTGPQRHEKIFEVDSPKKLPSTGVDSKFKGSLIDNSIESIQKLKLEGDDTHSAADPRFQSRQLQFPAITDVHSGKKTETKSKSDSTPSPTPSPTASPASKHSEKSAPDGR